MSNSLSISLPHPPKQLRPNTMRRCHWAPIAAARATARTMARQATMEAVLASTADLFTFTPRYYSIVWYYKGIRPDADNCLAACKAYLDGICDNLGINDRTLDVAHIIRHHDKAKAGTLTITFYDSYPANI